MVERGRATERWGNNVFDSLFIVYEITPMCGCYILVGKLADLAVCGDARMVLSDSLIGLICPAPGLRRKLIRQVPHSMKAFANIAVQF